MAKRRKKTAQKAPKEESLKSIRNRLKKLSDIVVRFRDNNTCQVYDCQRSGKGLHISHIFPAGAYPWMQFDPDNLVVKCYLHHFRFYHVDIMNAAQWVENHIPADILQELWSKAMEGKEQKEKIWKNSTDKKNRAFIIAYLYEVEADLLMQVESIKESGL